MLVLGEGNHAVADVAWREHVEVFAESAGGAAVVGYRDDGGQVANEVGTIAVQGGGYRGGSVCRTAGTDWGRDVVLEASEESGEAGASSDSDDAETRWCGFLRRVQPVKFTGKSDCARDGGSMCGMGFPKWKRPGLEVPASGMLLRVLCLRSLGRAVQ
jgi:hypothetical protein